MISSASAPVSRTRPPAHRRPRKRLTALVPVVVAALLLAASCSDDDDSTAPEPDESTTSPRPTTTAPPDRAESIELRDQIQELLRSYDQLLGELSAQPDLASNRNSAEYDDLRGLLAPDSPMTEPLINGLVAAGNRGERQLATGAHRFPVERRAEGRVRAVSDSEFVVMVCGYMNYGVFNGQNQQIELAEGHVEPSDATIVRVQDDLRIMRFDAVDSDQCQEAER